MLATLIDIGIALEDFKVILMLIPFLLGIWAWPKADKKVRLFFIYIAFGLLNVSAGVITSRLGNNIYQSYLYAPIEIICLTLIFLPDRKDHKLRTTAIVLASLALAMNVIEASFFQGGVGVFNSATYVIISLSIGILAIRQLLVLRFDITIDNLSKEPLFWIALSVAIHKFGNLINTSFFRSVQLSGDDAIIVMGLIRIVISYIQIILNSIALYIAKPFRLRPNGNSDYSPKKV
jgi:hypothetical protein